MTTFAFGVTGKSNIARRRNTCTVNTATGGVTTKSYRAASAAVVTRARSTQNSDSSSEAAAAAADDTAKQQASSSSSSSSSSSRRAVMLGGLSTVGSVAMGAALTTAAASTVVVSAEPAWAEDLVVADQEQEQQPPAPPPRTKKNVIITGSNSGIGYDAAAKLAARGYSVTLACRTLAKAEDAKRRILENAAASPAGLDLVPAECDLADLASVRRFAASWHASGAPLDVLVLNAGVQYSGDDNIRRTVDGFEITVGTNHLGHFLLANLLLPDMEAAANSGDVMGMPAGSPRVVITASEVHDPASPGGAVGPGAGLGGLSGLDALGADFEMLDGSQPYNADKAYKDSKLCNVLFARELERRLQAAGSPVQVNSFGPGLITRTGFFRYQNPLFVKIFDVATNDIFHVAETVDGGGDCLVYMVTSPELEGRGGLYYNNDLAPGTPTGHKFDAGEVSDEAKDDEEAAKLWRLSEKLVGLA